MRAVYSTKFLEGEVGDGLPLTYLVPDGYRAYVRDISGSLTPETGLMALFDVSTSALGTIYLKSAPIGRTVELHWYGMAVLYAGQHLVAELSTPAAVCSVIVSGYLLSLP